MHNESMNGTPHLPFVHSQDEADGKIEPKTLGDSGDVQSAAIVPYFKEASALPTDYPIPPAVLPGREFIWDADVPAFVNYPRLGHRLAEFPDLFRHPDHASGLLLAIGDPAVPLKHIVKASELASVI